MTGRSPCRAFSVQSPAPRRQMPSHLNPRTSTPHPLPALDRSTLVSRFLLLLPSTLDSRLSTLDSRLSTLDSRLRASGVGLGLRALKDVSFEVKRGELRILGRSEKEISKKCLGSTKVPDSGRRRHQLLGLIGHNGAGTQAAWQPLGRLPQLAPRVRRRGKARINTTLLKMLNGLIKPDRGTITMRGRVGAHCFLARGRNGFPSGIDGARWTTDYKTTGC
jgi:hypothetical protein